MASKASTISCYFISYRMTETCQIVLGKSKNTSVVFHMLKLISRHFREKDSLYSLQDEITHDNANVYYYAT